MKYVLALFLLLVPLSAQAEELYTPQPQCADIKNETDGKVFVAIRTDFYAKPDGTRSYYETVLHLDPGKFQQVCAKGPFFPDYKVLLMVKSLLPLFDCKTKMQGTIAVRSRPAKDNPEAHDYYATCVD